MLVPAARTRVDVVGQRGDANAEHSAGCHTSLDCEAGIVEVKRGVKSGSEWPAGGSIIPGWPIDTDVLEGAVLRVAEYLATGDNELTRELRASGVPVSDRYQATVDLAAQTVTTPAGTVYRFSIDPFRKNCLYRGLDSIGLTLQHEPAIAAYETRRKSEAPWLFSDLTSKPQ